MTTTTTILKAAAITRILKDAGFRHSEWLASGRVRGWGNSTEGFETTSEYTSDYKQVEKYHYTQKRGHHKRIHLIEVKTYTGRVFVDYGLSTNISAKFDPARITAQLDAITQTLTDKGFTVTQTKKYSDSRFNNRLIVTRAA